MHVSSLGLGPCPSQRITAIQSKLCSSLPKTISRFFRSMLTNSPYFVLIYLFRKISLKLLVFLANQESHRHKSLELRSTIFLTWAWAEYWAYREDLLQNRTRKTLISPCCLGEKLNHYYDKLQCVLIWCLMEWNWSLFTRTSRPKVFSPLYLGKEMYTSN